MKRLGSKSNPTHAADLQIAHPSHSIKNALRRTFAEKANTFAQTLSTLSLAIAGLSGEIPDQLSHVRRLHDNLPPLSTYLESLASLSGKCDEANIEENDFTTYTYDELAYELDLVRSAVVSKMGFLENQMVAREMTNLTPIQLEEFESVFRHFDRDMSNTLQELEFSAALASLGLVYDDEEMHEKFTEVSGGQRKGVTFEQFIRFMVDVTEDQNTAEQVFQSFKEVADGKVCAFPRIVFLSLPHLLLLLCTILLTISACPSHSTYTIPLYSPRASTYLVIHHLSANSLIPFIALRYRTRPPPFPRAGRSNRGSHLQHACPQGPRSTRRS